MTTDRPPTERTKWAFMALYWAVQAPLIYLSPLVVGIEPQKLLEAENVIALVLVAAGITALQALYLAPFVRPIRSAQRGRPLAVSMGVAALCVSGLALAMGFLLVSLVRLLDGPNLMHSDLVVCAAACAFAISWAAATPLLVAYARRGPPDEVLRHVARRVFQATAVEALALIPIDVMIRRRTSCYCGEGSYFALLLWIAVGLGVLGPFLLLVVISRRPRHRDSQVLGR